MLHGGPRNHRKFDAKTSWLRLSQAKKCLVAELFPNEEISDTSSNFSGNVPCRSFASRIAHRSAVGPSCDTRKKARRSRSGSADRGRPPEVRASPPPGFARVQWQRASLGQGWRRDAPGHRPESPPGRHTRGVSSFACLHLRRHIRVWGTTLPRCHPSTAHVHALFLKF